VIHAEMFRTDIGSNAHAWFSILKFCALSENKTVRLTRRVCRRVERLLTVNTTQVKENAFAASDAVLRVVGEYLVSEKDDSRKKLLNRLLKELLPVLADAEASGVSVSFTMLCINYLSPAIMLYLGEIGFLKIEARLRKYGENLLMLSNAATAMRWSVFSNFIRCIASFAEQVISYRPLLAGLNALNAWCHSLA
jgi:hypothetical protein